MSFEKRSLALGAGLGLVVAGGAFAVASVRGSNTPEVERSFTVTNNTVVLQEGKKRPLHFDTAVVESGKPLPRPPLTGRVTSSEQRTGPTFPPLEGRIERVAIALGDRVKQGDHLVLVRSGDLAVMLRELNAQRLTVQTKKALVERLTMLIESRAGSENDLIVAKAELAEAELSAKAADARLKSLAVAEEGDNLYWLLAGRQGTVVQLDAIAGQEVGPNKDKPVVTVANLDEVLVLADVPPHDAVGLAPKARATIVVPGADKDPIVGEVVTVAEVVDPERQTVPVRIKVGNLERKLRPNAFVQVTIEAEQSSTVMHVPSEAVLSDGTVSVVFVETKPGAFERRQVVVGREANHRTEVSGLKGDERVVTRGALLLLNALGDD